jgi:hypothetical protein
VDNFSKADELAKLANLRDQGLISQRDFTRQKRALLGGSQYRSSLIALSVVAAVVVAVLAVGVTQSNVPKKPVTVQLSSATSPSNSAAAWARSMIGSPLGTNGHYYWFGCLAFAVNAYQIGASYPIRSQVTVAIGSNTYPSQVWGHFSGGGQVGHDMSPPVGALVFWNSKGGTVDSHVAVSIGGGVVVSTNVQQNVPGANGIHTETMAQFAQNSWNLYDGWWLPDPSKPSAPAPTSPPTAAAPAPSAPAPTPTAPTVTGTSSAPAGTGSVAGTGPVAGATGTQAGGSISNPAPAQPPSSSSAPQSSGSSSTPPIVTTTTVANTPASVQAPPPPPALTWTEYAGGPAHTWTNYTNAGGNEGSTIPPNQPIQIACKLPGFTVQDGNTWWYRIAQSPWNNAYYVSADAFYNNGATSGSLHGTPFVDPAVANC